MKKVLYGTAALLIGGLIALFVVNQKRADASRTTPAITTPEGKKTAFASKRLGNSTCQGRGPCLADIQDSGIVVDPRSPSYNSVTLRRTGVSASEIWAAEPRDDKWAPVMENTIAPYLKSDLAVTVPGGVDDVVVECRTASCRMSVTATEEKIKAVNATFSLISFGNTNSRSKDSFKKLPDGRIQFSVVALFDELRDAEKYPSAYAERRKEKLARLHSDSKLPEYINVLPKE